MGFMAFLAFVFFAVLFFIVVIMRFILLRQRTWSNKKRKLVFSFIASVLMAPVLLPAATIMVVPVPNILVLVSTLSTGEFSQLFDLYSRIYSFSGPAYLITLALMGLLSQIVFFKRK